MNPEHCKKNAIAYYPALERPKNGYTKPKFFILLDDVDKKTDTIIVATFTTNLKFKDRPWVIFVPKGYFKDPFGNRSFPYEDCVLDCNTCYEIPAKVVRSGRCKFICFASESWVSRIYKSLEYATKIEPRLILKLRRRLNLK